MKFSRVFVLTGAGISAESGIKTFRDADGLWEGHRIEDVATPEAFARNPALVYEFYNQRRRQLQAPGVEPNGGHLALARFEKSFPGELLLVTQNVDNLHERAGSEKLLHMHGELLKARCLGTQKVFPWTGDLTADSIHPEGLGHRLRPHIVWFGEVPFYLDEAYDFLSSCDLFIAIGTSGVVYPAAGFVQATRPDCHRVEINLKKTDISGWFDRSIEGAAGETVGDFLRECL